MQNKYCKDCPMRLYNIKCNNLGGYGNPWSDKLIIVPNVDYIAYKQKDFKFSNYIEVMSSIFPTGGLEGEFYILPLIRCNTNLGCVVTNDVYKHCINHLVTDFKIYNFKHVLCLGDVSKYMLNINNISKELNNVYISKNSKYYYINYSPFIKYIDEKLFDIFRINFIKWYNAITFNNYSKYKFYRI